MIKKKITKKKGMSQMWWIIGTAILVVVFIIFFLVWFRGTGESATGTLKEKIRLTQDCDQDGVADLFDKCPCEPEETGAKYKGCPIKYEAQEGLQQQAECNLDSRERCLQK